MAHFSLFPTPVGTCAIAWRDDRVVATHLPEETDEGTASLIAHRADASEAEPTPRIREAIAAITALLGNGKTDLSGIDCDFGGIDPFSVRVYAATRAIPPGETRSYGEIAT